MAKVKYSKKEGTFFDGKLEKLNTGIGLPFKEASAPVNPTQINNFFKHLMGEALTIVEATTTDEVQRKAIKSVMGNLIHNRSVEMQQWIIRQAESERSGLGQSDPFPYNW